MDSGEEGWLERFSDLILQTQNVNVIRVDWRESSRQIDYTQAATDTQVSNFKITFIFTLTLLSLCVVVSLLYKNNTY